MRFSASEVILRRDIEVLERIDLTDSSISLESSLERLDWRENLRRKPLGMTLKRTQIERKEILAVILAKDTTILTKWKRVVWMWTDKQEKD